MVACDGYRRRHRLLRADRTGLRLQPRQVAAHRDGSDWILNGSKMWITNGSVADVAIVWARSKEDIIGFVVPAGTPAFRRGT